MSGSFGVVFAEEYFPRSADEIKVEIQKIREELATKTLENALLSRMVNSLTDEEKLEKEVELLSLKNKLADLDYELAKIEKRTISKVELLQTIHNKQNRTTFNRGNSILRK